MPTLEKPAPSNGFRVVLADDDHAQREQTARMLEQLELPILEARSGREVLARIDPETALVLLDVALPDIDGFEVCRRIKSNGYDARPRVLLTSNALSPTERARALDSGADGVIVQPADPVEFMATVRALLRGYRSWAREHGRRVELERRAQRVTESGAAGILFWRIDGKITFANSTFLRMLGFDHLDLEHGGLDWRTITPLDSAAADSRAFEDLRSNGHTVLYEKQLMHQSGQRVDVLVGLAPFERSMDEGIAVVLNMTSHKRADDELRRRSDFHQQLLAMTGHDLRSPLQIIQLSISAMRRMREDAPDRHVLLDRIEASTRRAAHLVDDLFDLSQAQLGSGIRIRPRRMDLAETARQVTAGLAEAHLNGRIELQVMGDADGVWDPDRMAQVITNLVNNAFQYGSPAAPVKVRIEAANGDVILSVWNEGPVIPSAYLPRMFLPFSRGDSSVENRRGLGIGLFIVERIVRAHHGEVSVSSGVLEGTTFSVTLPRHQPLAHEAEPPSLPL
jgi:phosphoserine phosphatase RsbU/P